MKGRSILLLAGEASGDYHAAALARDLKRLRPEIKITGIGGELLEDAGMELLAHYKDINAVGPREGLSKLRKILAVYNEIKARLKSGEYDLFIPVDYPDVNLRLARGAKRAGVKVCYFISPQVWAWRKGRIKQIRAHVDQMMTIFPFEAEFYRDLGINAKFVGHTMARDIEPEQDVESLRSELELDDRFYWVAIAPGSRPTEVKRILPRMIQAGKIFRNAYQDVRFAIPLAGEHLRPLITDILEAFSEEARIVSKPAAHLMAACRSALVTSGTATLQAALVGTPHAVVYILDPPSWFVAMRILRPLVMDKDLHVAIANVLSIYTRQTEINPIDIMEQARAGVKCMECQRPLLVPELLQGWASPEAMAEWLARFRTDPSLTRAMRAGFAQIREMLAPRGTSNVAAISVLEVLEGSDQQTLSQGR
jgi:lipid-A-disaccharide synthase